VRKRPFHSQAQRARAWVLAPPGDDTGVVPAYRGTLLRRLLVLTCVCPLGLLFGVTYLAENPTQASAAQSSSAERGVSRAVDTRQRLVGGLEDRAREIAYGLERAKDELGALIP
jgi:hypothetical protein